MTLFKKKMTPEEFWNKEFNWEKSLRGLEIEALNKHFSENMIHAYVRTPEVDKHVLLVYDFLKKKVPPKTPEEEKHLKNALATAYREGWEPHLTYGAFKGLSERVGREKFDEKLRELYNKAKASKRQLVDEVMLDFCTPQEKEMSIREAKESELPLWEVAEFNATFKNINSDLKKEIYSMAKYGHIRPVEAARIIVEKYKKTKR
jgi:hypothetical protein